MHVDPEVVNLLALAIGAAGFIISVASLIVGWKQYVLSRGPLSEQVVQARITSISNVCEWVAIGLAAVLVLKWLSVVTAPVGGVSFVVVTLFGNQIETLLSVARALDGDTSWWWWAMGAGLFGRLSWLATPDLWRVRT
ncbi:MAG: hypothetical protein ACRD0P_08910 [Stackebrandtia sp.]